MSFLRFFRRKKDSSGKKDSEGKKKDKKKGKGKNKTETPLEIPELKQETRRQLYSAEFRSLGDVNSDNSLTKEEFTRLMMLLGYPQGIPMIEKIWKDNGMEDDSRMTMDQYVNLMLDESVSSETNTWRKLFACFDSNGNAVASKSDVIKGLEKIGLDITPEMRKKVDQMDTNKDGKISYEEFLKAQLKQ